MNARSLINSFAALNTFAVKVAAYGDTLVAYRTVFGVNFAVKGKAEQRAVVDYVTRVTKPAQAAAKLSPLAKPKTPPSLQAVQNVMRGGGYMYARELPGLSYAQQQWVAWNMPVDMTLHLAMQHLEGAPYPQN